MKEILKLADIPWLVIGKTNRYSKLKEDIGIVCRDVTEASCIDEICINDILYMFRIHGYEVVKKKDLLQ